MRICHLSQTPIAGAPWAWSESFKEAGYDSFCVAGRIYGDGRVMPSDERWPPTERGIRMIHEADLIFCHQGKPYRQKWYPKDKPTVAIYHSQPTPGHTDRMAERHGWPWAAIGQWEERLYPGCKFVPNLVPLKHPWYQPGDKPTDRVRIVYSPSNKNLPGWDDKGYERTFRILEGLKGPGVEVDIITGTPLEECLRRKSTAHVCIDECVTGAYHRSSLEALALGCVVVNACDARCEWLIRQMTGGAPYPFTHCTMPELPELLDVLIADDVEFEGTFRRKWMLGNWQPAELINRNFKPLMDAAFEHSKNIAA